jgi:tetratricopeptide (TPR) repeat protein
MVKSSSSAAVAAALLSLSLSVPAEAGSRSRSGGIGAVFVWGETLAADCSRRAASGESGILSLEVCDRALEEEVLTVRNRAATHVNRGVIQMRRHKLDAALADFSQAAALRPSMSEAYANSGFVLNAAGRHADALPQLDRALVLGVPKPELTYYHRAVAREALADNRGAYADYRKAAQLNPGWDEPRAQMGRFTLTRP